MAVLTPQQQAKHWRLTAQSRTIHATLMSFRDRRAELRAKLNHIDGQIDSERQRGKRFSQAMLDEIELLKAPIVRELDALVAEEAAVTGQWRQASQLVQALDRYVKTLGRAN